MEVQTQRQSFNMLIVLPQYDTNKYSAFELISDIFNISQERNFLNYFSKVSINPSQQQSQVLELLPPELQQLPWESCPNSKLTAIHGTIWSFPPPNIHKRFLSFLALSNRSSKTCQQNSKGRMSFHLFYAVRQTSKCEAVWRAASLNGS